MASISIPELLPTPSQDAEKLKRAFEAALLNVKKQGWLVVSGLGTDERAVITILGRRNAEQRMQISLAYESLYKQSLIASLESELSGDFRKAVILWVQDPPQRDAKLAREALRKKGTKHKAVIIEIACAASPHHLVAVRQAYCSLFDCSLEEDITLYVPQPLRKLLLSLVSSYRYDKEVVDEYVAKLEAGQLHEAVKKKHLDQEHILWILSTRNESQLKATFNFYNQDYGKPFEQDIKNCGNSEFLSLLRTATWCIETPEKHFAEVIRESIVGLGTDEDSLTRAIVTRAEVDMLNISEEYYKVNKGSLADAVIGDTSGDYKDFLLTLIGEMKRWRLNTWLGVTPYSKHSVGHSEQQLHMLVECGAIKPVEGLSNSPDINCLMWGNNAREFRFRHCRRHMLLSDAGLLLCMGKLFGTRICGNHVPINSS
ncbi:hypothetical protein ACLOJK_024717 [Asimina triloba]